MVPHVPDSALSALLAEPLLAKLPPTPPAVWRSLVACTGNDYCHFSLIDTKTHAFNLATFLFSFDADNDLSNGVEIPEALGPLVSEPFVWTHKRFTETRAFARVMQQARLSGAWSAGVRLYPPRVAMMRLDEANGIEAVTRELVAERQLFDGAAYLDRAYELDAYGNRTSSAGYGTPSTGTLQFYTLAYDPDGNLTALERLQQRSRGLYTFALTAAYNEFGGLVEVDRSVNLSAPNTGDRNGHEAEQFVWNANGLRASGSGQHLITDAIMDPINAQVTYGYIYDAAGNLTTSTETWSAALADRGRTPRTARPAPRGETPPGAAGMRRPGAKPSSRIASKAVKVCGPSRFGACTTTPRWRIVLPSS